MNEKEHDWLRQMVPLAVPWRERARHEATALALLDKGATDAQAAALFAYEVAELRRELAQARADLARPIMGRMAAEHTYAADGGALARYVG